MKRRMKFNARDTSKTLGLMIIKLLAFHFVILTFIPKL